MERPKDQRDILQQGHSVDDHDFMPFPSQMVRASKIGGVAT